MSVEDIVERALRDRAGEVSAAPDVEALLARGIRARRRRSVGVLASAVAATVTIGAVLFGPVLWRGADSSPVTNTATSASAAPNNAGAEWGPDIPFSSLMGVPYAGGVKWPAVDSVASMTIVGGGVVYVLPDRRIVYESWQHESTVIGQTPWYGADPLDFDMSDPREWARGVVGSPGHDLVAWFETVGGHRGDLVVVQPSTGDELARTAVPGPVAIRASILAVGDEYVYFSAQSAKGRRGGSHEPDRRLSWLPSSWPWDDVWSWRWDTGRTPAATGRQVQDVDDISAGVWARTIEPKLHFESTSGKRLSTVGSWRYERAQWRGLSPDGRFWFSFGAALVTATGKDRTFDAEMDVESFAWTGRTKVTIIGARGAMVCDAETITCTTPVALVKDARGVVVSQPPTQ